MVPGKPRWFAAGREQKIVELSTWVGSMETLTPEILLQKYRVPPDGAEAPPLCGIENIPWAKLSHAHGASHDVPALLRAALSSNQDHQEFALILLCETIWHQGTVYEATAYAVPFLFRMLEWSNTPDKRGIAVLLAGIADGYGAWAQPARQAVGEQLPLLYPYLSDPDASLYVGRGLAHYPERADQIVPLLKTVLAAMEDRETADELKKGIAKLEQAISEM